MSDLERAYKVLNGKASGYKTAFDYYDGNQPLVYSTRRLQDAFQNMKAHFEQNWCAVVIDSVIDRLVLKGFTAKDKADTETLKAIFARNHIELDAYDAHQAALITHEAYLIAWKDEDGSPQLWYNDPRLCHLFYRSDNPKKKEFACKWWVDQGDGKTRLNLYYPDRIEHYISRAKNPQSDKSFIEDPDNAREDNPYDTIPVFHLHMSRRGRGSELTNIVTLQDAVNKLLSDMMVASEFGSWMQRWAITNADMTSIENSPTETWIIPPSANGDQPTSVGQFEPQPLSGFLEAIDKLASSIAIISRTPKHYFYGAGTGISGEALLAMEAPLIKKVKQRQENFAVTWQEIGAFLLKLETGRDVPPEDLTVTWEPAGSVQPYTEAQARKTSVDAGIPLVTELRREGWGEDELAQMKKDEDDAKAKTTAMATALLDKARVDQEQQNPPGQAVTNMQPAGVAKNGNQPPAG
jgi:hypothetical protein